MTVAMPPKGLGSAYWKLWTASAVSNLGDGLALIAIPWLASAVTRDPLHIALVTFASRLPWLLLSLPAGVITDRVDRRRLIAWMDVSRAAVVLSFAYVVLSRQDHLAAPDEVASGASSDHLLLILLYGAAFLLGSAEVLRDNTAQTLLPSIVAREHLEKANGRLWGVETVTNQFVGQLAAGVILGLAFAARFFINAGTFAIAAALVFTLAGRFTPQGQTRTGRIAWRAEIGEGLRWLWRHSLLRSLAVVLAGANGLHAAAMASFVLFAQEILAVDAAGFGLLMTGAAIGALASTVLVDHVGVRRQPGLTLLISLASWTVGLLIIGLSSSAFVIWLMMVAEGFFMILWNSITVSLRQTIIPDHLLGRVNAVYRFFGWGAISLGTLVGGAIVAIGETPLSREWALRAPLVVAAVGYVALFAYALPRLTTARITAARAVSVPE